MSADPTDNETAPRPSNNDTGRPQAPGSPEEPHNRASTAILSSSREPPHLSPFEGEAIRLFQRRYDTYVHAVKARAQSFVLDETKCLRSRSSISWNPSTSTPPSI
ncbi:unnamed protein product [Agarophyton chilense]